MISTDLLPLIAVLAGTGVIAGLVAGLLGVGGGIVIVPVLFTLFGIVGVNDEVRMHLAVGTSLAVIIWTSVSSMWAHAKKGALDFSILRSWAVWIVLGAAGGTVLAAFVGSEFLKANFAVIALVMSIYMFATSPNFTLAASPPKGLTKAASGFAISAASALMGIGGGTIFVPFLNAFGVPVHRSVGTAAGLGLLIAVPASAGFVATGWSDPRLPIASLGYVNLLGLVVLAPISMATAPLGAKLAHSLSPLLLKRAFAAFLLLTSIRMAWSLI